MQEWLGAGAAMAGLPVVLARLFNVIGPGQPDWRVPAGFARQIAASERSRRVAIIRARNLRAGRDFTDVRDVVRALRMLAVKGKSGEVYNVCSGRETQVGDLLESLLRSADVRRPRIVTSEDRDVKWQRGSFEKVARLGWRPRITMARSLVDILQDWRHRQGA